MRIKPGGEMENIYQIGEEFVYKGVECVIVRHADGFALENIETNEICPETIVKTLEKIGDIIKAG